MALEALSFLHQGSGCLAAWLLGLDMPWFLALAWLIYQKYTPTNELQA
jgi:hypothetical protein